MLEIYIVMSGDQYFYNHKLTKCFRDKHELAHLFRTKTNAQHMIESKIQRFESFIKSFNELGYPVDEFEVELAKWQKAKVKKVVIESIVDISQIA